MGNNTSLNQKQELFCRYYTSNRECFSNGVKSYAKAYDYGEIEPESSSWRTCQVNASRLLSEGKIKNRIREILDESGLNDLSVDLQLSSLISQNENLTVKLGGIREYNKLRQRVMEKSEISIPGMQELVEKTRAGLPD